MKKMIVGALLLSLIVILPLWLFVLERDAESDKKDTPTVVYKYVGPETLPVSDCFITDDQFLICKLGEN